MGKKEQISYEGLIQSATSIRKIASEIQADNKRVLEIFNILRDSGSFSESEASKTAYQKISEFHNAINSYIKNLESYGDFLDKTVVANASQGDLDTQSLWNNATSGFTQEIK